MHICISIPPSSWSTPKSIQREICQWHLDFDSVAPWLIALSRSCTHLLQSDLFQNVPKDFKPKPKRHISSTAKPIVSPQLTFNMQFCLHAAISWWRQWCALKVLRFPKRNNKYELNCFPSSGLFLQIWLCSISVHWTTKVNKHTGIKQQRLQAHLRYLKCLCQWFGSIPIRGTSFRPNDFQPNGPANVQSRHLNPINIRVHNDSLPLEGFLLTWLHHRHPWRPGGKTAQHRMTCG